MDFLLPALAVVLVIGLITWLLRPAKDGESWAKKIMPFGGGGGRGRR